MNSKYGGWGILGDIGATSPFVTCKHSASWAHRHCLLQMLVAAAQLKCSCQLAETSNFHTNTNNAIGPAACAVRS